MEPTPNPLNFWDYVFIVCSSVTGVIVRLSHTWSARAEAHSKRPDKVPPPIVSLKEAIAALVTAPGLGIMAGGLGQWLNMPMGAIYGMAGFAGLAGPSLLLSLWNNVIEPRLITSKKED